MTRKGRRPSGWKDYEKDATDYECMFASLFQTAVKVIINEGLKNDTSERTPVTSEYILGCLYRYGNIAYDTETGLFLPYYAEGELNAYGQAKRYRLYSPYTGTTQSQARDKLYLFTANPAGVPPARFMRTKAALLADIDNTITQNLDQIKECTVIKGVDEELAEKVLEADQKRRDGASMVFLQEKAAQFARAENFKTGGTYYVNQLQEARRTELEDAYRTLGIKTPIEKASGVTEEEMQTQNARTSAFLNVLITTCNQQAKAQGADIAFVAADEWDTIQEGQKGNKEPTQGEGVEEDEQE